MRKVKVKRTKVECFFGETQQDIMVSEHVKERGIAHWQG